MFQEINYKDYIYYPTSFSICIHRNRFLDTQCIVLKSYHTQSFFSLLCFLFVDLDYEVYLNRYRTRVKSDILTQEKIIKTLLKL